MRLRDKVIGTINAFSTQDTVLGDDERRVVQGLADIATIAILQERSISRAEALTEQLQSALHSRIVIEQAKGALARIEGVSGRRGLRDPALPGQVEPAAAGRHRGRGARPALTAAAAHAPVSQPVEEVALKATQSGFDSQRGHPVPLPGS